MFSSIKSKLKIRTFPVGNLAKYSLVMFVSPNTKLGHVLTFAPEYSAAIKTLKALKLSGYVNKVWKNMGYFENMYLKQQNLSTYASNHDVFVQFWKISNCRNFSTCAWREGPGEKEWVLEQSRKIQSHINSWEKLNNSGSRSTSIEEFKKLCP